MTGDPFAPARRALLVAPALAVLGAALLYVGVAGEGLAWLLSIPGGLLILNALLRGIGALVVLRIERRRRRLLREGVPGTARIVSTRRLGTRAGFPIFESEVEAAAPGGETTRVTRRGAVPPQFETEITAGAELPTRVDPRDPTDFAIDWDAL